MKLLQTLAEYVEVAGLQKEMAVYFKSFREQKEWLTKLKQIDKNVACAHNASHILKFLLAILKLPASVNGCLVEAGAYKGGGTAKISLFAKHTNRKLFVFDSFCGLPGNDEPHQKSITGYSIKDWFGEGKFAGSLEEVKSNVAQFGEPAVCSFIPGWFNETMPSFKEPIALAYLDVDLAASTRTCLQYLYPLIAPGGAIYSQDGDFPLVIDVFKDERFWKEEVGLDRLPEIEGLGKKITIIHKR